MSDFTLPDIHLSDTYDFRTRVVETDIQDGLPFIVDRVSLAYQIGTTPRKIGHVMHSVLDPKIGKWVYNKNNFYTTFEIPKNQSAADRKRGIQRVRKIQSPKRPLKGIQRGLATNFWNHFPVPDCVTSYIKGTSIKDTATKHYGKDLIVVIDIKDFFPSIREHHIRKFLLKRGYPYYLARTISELSTFRSFLPQGSPCSPIISNLIGGELFDQDVQLIADEMGYLYTRYADDLIFSCNETTENHREGSSADLLVSRVSGILGAAGFRVAKRKTKFMRSKSPKIRQSVLGLVVNQNVGPHDPAHNSNEPFVRVSHQKSYRTLRVMLHNALTYGVEGAARQRGETGAYFFSKLQSYIKSFLGQCDERRMNKLIDDLELVKALWRKESTYTLPLEIS